MSGLRPVADSPLASQLASSDERRRHDPDPVSGGQRLLRDLVRGASPSAGRFSSGLLPQALRGACLLICELDTPRDVDRVVPQTGAERLESRQRVAGEREVTGGRKQRAA